MSNLPETYKTLADGSIDYGFYDRKARILRSRDTGAYCMTVKQAVKNGCLVICRLVGQAFLRTTHQETAAAARLQPVAE